MNAGFIERDNDSANLTMPDNENINKTTIETETSTATPGNSQYSEPADDDICRFCRSEATPDKPLYHPCMCAGSIKYIHQDCLTHWLKYSDQDHCELCHHKFTFVNIYSPDMPKRVPMKILLLSLAQSLTRAAKEYLHLTLVIFAWVVLTPVITSRLCGIFLDYSKSTPTSLYTIIHDMLRPSDMLPDIIQGCFIVTCSLVVFIGMCWLRDQVINHSPPESGETVGNLATQINQTSTQAEQLARITQYSQILDRNNVTPPAWFVQDSRFVAANRDRLSAANHPQPSSSSSAPSSTNPSLIDSSTQTTPSDQSSSSHRSVVTDNPPPTDSSSQNPLYRSNEISNQQTNTNTGNTSRFARSLFDTQSSHTAGQRSDSSTTQTHQRSSVTTQPVSQIINNALIGNRPASTTNHTEQNDPEDSDDEDEITWDRVLGFDGSMLFLQHVLYIVGLSGLSIVVFAFIPYNAGARVLWQFSLDRFVPQSSPFNGIITCTVGYVTLACLMALLSRTIRNFAPSHIQRKLSTGLWSLDFGYICLKVSLMIAFEVIFLPWALGWCIDLSSLSLVGTTFAERLSYLISSPYTSSFVHWILGVIFLLSFNFLLSILQNIIKPNVYAMFYDRSNAMTSGLLGSDDSYDSNPFYNSIHKAVSQFALSAIEVSGSLVVIILFMIYLPVKLIQLVTPGFLPYYLDLWTSPQPNLNVLSTPNMSSSTTINNTLFPMSTVNIAPTTNATHSVQDNIASDPYSEMYSQLNIELLILQMFIPTMMTIDGHLMREWLQKSLELWCRVVFTLLGFEHLLEETNREARSSAATAAPTTPGTNSADQSHDGQVRRRRRTRSASSIHDDNFPTSQAPDAIHTRNVNDHDRSRNGLPLWLSVFSLLVAALGTIFLVGLAAITLPASIGRLVMKLIFIVRFASYLDHGSSLVPASLIKDISRPIYQLANMNPLSTVDTSAANLISSLDQEPVTIIVNNTTNISSVPPLLAVARHHEYNTIALGLYVIFTVVRLVYKLVQWRQRQFGLYVNVDARIVARSIAIQLRSILQTIVIGFLFLVLIPFVIGILFNVSLVEDTGCANWQSSHINIPPSALMPRLYADNSTNHQRSISALSQGTASPISVVIRGSKNYYFFIFIQNWIMGLFLVRIGVSYLLLWNDRSGRMRNNVALIYEQGLTNIEFSEALWLAGSILFPLCNFAIGPAMIVYTVLPLLGYNDPLLLECAQRITYRYIMYLVIATLLVGGQVRRLISWYHRVRDDCYLVGRRLVNYNPPATRTSAVKTS